MLINTVKNVIYIVFCFISIIYLPVKPGMFELRLLAVFLFFFALPVLLEGGGVNRYEKKEPKTEL